MPQFKYIARSRTGEKIEGKVEAQERARELRRAVGVVEESRGGSATTATGQGHATTVTRQARMPVSVTSGP